MSYTTVMSVDPNRKPKSLLELHNASLTAPFIWGRFARMYYGLEWYQYDRILDYLWPRWKDLSIPKSYRAVLMMTFDLAYVRKEHYAQAATDIRHFLKEANGSGHWERIAEFYESEPEPAAVAIWQTSVSENPFEGPWNETLNRHELLDWEETYEIYDELEKIENL